MSLININSTNIVDCVTAGQDPNPIHRDPVAVKILRLATEQFMDLKREYILSQGLIKREDCKSDEEFNEEVNKAALKCKLDDEVMFSEMDLILGESNKIIAPGIFGAIQADNYRPNGLVYRVMIKFGREPVFVPELGLGSKLTHNRKGTEHFVNNNDNLFASVEFSLEEVTMDLNKKVMTALNSEYAVNSQFEFTDEKVEAYVRALCSDYFEHNITELVILNTVPGRLLDFAARFRMHDDYTAKINDILSKSSSRYNLFKSFIQERKEEIAKYVQLEIDMGYVHEEDIEERKNELNLQSMAIFISQDTKFDPKALERTSDYIWHQVGLRKFSPPTGKVSLYHVVRNNLHEPVAAGTSEVQYVPLLTPQILRYCQNRQLNIDTLKRM